MPTPKPTGSNYEAPVAPDTSVQAFINANPDYEKDAHLLYSDGYWIWEKDRLTKIKSAYDSWKMRLDNQYQADVENYKNAFGSYVNQADMLEAAGYNRNWLGAGGNPLASSYSPTPSAGPSRLDRQMVTPQDMLGFAAQASQIALDAYDKVAGVKVKKAQSDNLEAQAELTRAMTPFKLTKSYFDSLPNYLKWYGSQGSDLAFFSPSQGHGVTFQSPASDSMGNQMLDNAYRIQQQQLAGIRLHNEYQALSNKEKSYVLKAIQPMQLQLLRAQKNLQIKLGLESEARTKVHGETFGVVKTQNEILDTEKELRRIAKEIQEKYGMKGAAQQYFTNWVNLGINAVKTGAYAYSTFATRGASGAVGALIPDSRGFAPESSLYGFGTPTDW